MQNSGLQRTILGYSAQRNTKKSREKRRRRLQRTKTCPAPKMRAAAHQRGCSAPKTCPEAGHALQRVQGALQRAKRGQECVLRAAARPNALQRVSAPCEQNPSSKNARRSAFSRGLQRATKSLAPKCCSIKGKRCHLKREPGKVKKTSKGGRNPSSWRSLEALQWILGFIFFHLFFHVELDIKSRT